jgi:hypothetical protein
MIVLTRSTAKKLINMQGHVDESFETAPILPPNPTKSLQMPISNYG